MTVKLNLDRLDDHLVLSRGDVDPRVQESTLYGAISGDVTVGRYVLRIGDPSGASVREASPSERARFRLRPSPVLRKPRLIRGLFGRQSELSVITTALDAGLPVEISGEPGIGKTAILRHLAHHPRAASYADGIVYIPARHQPASDLVQLVFEAFYESAAVSRPTDAAVRRGLQTTSALFLLDDADLAQHELEEVLDVAPRSAFVVATRERRLWGEARPLALKGLTVEDSVLLLEREIERPLADGERSAALRLSAALGGHPLRLLQAAALAREHAIPIDTIARGLAPASVLGELVASIGDKPRRALTAMSAVAGVPLPVQHLSGIAETADLEPSLQMLGRRGLVLSGHSRHHLADGVADQLRRTDDGHPSANRAITYFTAWAVRHRRNPETLLDESAALLRVQQSALELRRWGEALRLGKLLEPALAVGARWGAWGIAVERCLAAAKAIGDRSAEAWALHQLGTRAVCLGEPGKARAALGQAAKLRESIGEEGPAATSRATLALILAPLADHEERPYAALDFDELPLREDDGPTFPAARRGRLGDLALAAVSVACLVGLVYWFDTSGARPASPPKAPAFASAVRGIARTPLKVEELSPSPRVPPPPTASTEVPVSFPPPAAPASAPPAAAPDRASILIFTPRPGSIAMGGPVSLCYAVSGAVRARVEPDIGDVSHAASALTCVPVSPSRTTTYELTASGRDGHPVRQQLVIVVR